MQCVNKLDVQHAGLGHGMARFGPAAGETVASRSITLRKRRLAVKVITTLHMESRQHAP